MNVADFRLADLGGASPSADDLAQAQGIADLRQQGFDLVETFAHDVGRAATCGHVGIGQDCIEVFDALTEPLVDRRAVDTDNFS